MEKDRAINISPKYQFEEYMYTTDKRTDVWSRPSCIYTQIFSPTKNCYFHLFGVKKIKTNKLVNKVLCNFSVGTL